MDTDHARYTGCELQTPQVTTQRYPPPPCCAQQRLLAALHRGLILLCRLRGRHTTSPALRLVWQMEPKVRG